jgi:hypothetical protein
MGVGIENVLDCERAVQKLLKIRRVSPPNAEELTRQILISRGDRVTMGIRKRINTIMACLEESTTPPIVAERSGDEIRVLVANDPENALLAHINTLETRVSKVSISNARQSLEVASPERITEHGKALDFIGTTETYSKYLELMLRYAKHSSDGGSTNPYVQLMSKCDGFYLEGNYGTSRATLCFVHKDGSITQVSDAQFVQDFTELYIGLFK